MWVRVNFRNWNCDNNWNIDLFDSRLNRLMKPDAYYRLMKHDEQ